MFGMDDPGQVLPQIKGYVEDGRLEISEVMSVELIEKLRAQKNRDIQTQTWLVEAARIGATVLEQREKYSQSLAAAMTLNKERNSLRSMLSAEQISVDSIDVQAAEDYVQAARVAAQCGKLGKACRLAKKSNKTVRNHLGSAIVCLQAHSLAKGNLRKGGKHAINLVRVIEKSGSVVRVSGSFSLQPEGQPATDLVWLMSNLDYWLDPTQGLPEKSAIQLREITENLRGQMAAIESGEQAANAKLQAAVDKLNPDVDYHSYSRGN